MNKEEMAKGLLVFLIEKNPELIKGENNDLAKVAEKVAAAYKSILTALKS